MKKHVFVVLTNPVEGREDEFNDWYSNTHLPDVLKVPGFVSAQRFRLSDEREVKKPYKYLAIYEIEAEDPNEALKTLFKATKGMVISDSQDLNSTASWVFSPITEKLTA